MEHQYHRELKHQVAQFLTRNGWQPIQEFVLPNNKCADILARNRAQNILIAEVKTIARPYHISEALSKYQQFADALYIAAPFTDALILTSEPQLLDWQTDADAVGVLGLTANTVKIIRTARRTTIHPDNLAKLVEAITLRAPTW